MGAPVPGVAGLLLTGGASRRMGQDKARLVVAGRPCAERLGVALAAATSPALEVGPGASPLTSVPDLLPGEGPLAALASGWAALERHGHGGPAIVVACDMPFVTPELLRFLASWPGRGSAVPTVAGHPQPLCSRISSAALASCADLVAEGGRSLRPLLDRADTTLLGEDLWGSVADATELADFDTPEDLRRLVHERAEAGAGTGATRTP